MNLSTAVFISDRLDSKCSFSQVADSDDTNVLPVTFPAEDAILMRKGSTPSISGMSTVAYRSRMLAGDPWAWFRTTALFAWAQAFHCFVKFSNIISEIVSR